MGQVAITVDYESDWGGRMQSTYAIEKMTDRVLEILDKNHAKATFFISTQIAERTRKNILDIYNAGHEIASHGHNHYFNYDKLSRNEIKFEMIESKKILEDLIGANIYGFRTPYFKKNKYTDELLLESNYKYDSSAVETSLYGRYENKQYNTNNAIQHFNVSTIYNKLPAGLKWINIFGNNITSTKEPKVLYLHLFDLLSLKATCLDKNFTSINMKYKLFYMARFGSIINTLNKVSNKSKQIIRFVK